MQWPMGHMGPHWGHAGPAWSRPYPWMSHIRYMYASAAATGVAWLLAALYLVSAVAAAAVALLLYRGYRVSGDQRLALLSIGFGLVAVGSLVDLASGVMVSTSLSWLAYMLGYMVMLAARDVRGEAEAEAYAATPFAAAVWASQARPYSYAPPAMIGSLVAGALAFAAFLGVQGRLRIAGLGVAASHVLEAVALLGVLYPGLLVASVALRAASLAAMTLVLVLATRSGPRL